MSLSKIVLVFLFFNGICFAQKVRDQDKLAFSINGEVYLFSDLDNIHYRLKIFKCTLGSSVFFPFFKFKNIDQKLDISKQSEVIKRRTQPLLLLIKSLMILEKNNISLTKKMKSLIQSSSRRNNCLADYKTTEKVIADLVKLELFFKKNFNLENFAITKLEFSRGKGKFPNLSDKKIFKILRKLKQERKITDYFLSIDSQVKHREFL